MSMNVSKKKECKFLFCFVLDRIFFYKKIMALHILQFHITYHTTPATSFFSHSEFQTITAGKYKRTVTPTKKITKEDVQKSKEDIEDVLKLFKTFVKENRPSLDIEKVATGETWFGTDALALNLCDEIRTVDEVVTEYVDKGYTVYDVKYEPPVPELQSELSRLLPIGGARTNKNNLVSRAVRWLARTVASEFTSELEELQTSTRPDRKYMMKDDTADRIRMD
jgi:ClpP class serine protease